MAIEKFHDYYAFICHRSADKPVALAIQKKLERYAIPKKIIEDNGYPSSHIRHVCVDITEFEDSNLHADILKCLEKSDKLIVICSELSASPVDDSEKWFNENQLDWRNDPVGSGWVGFEILNFINIDRKADGLEPFSCIDEIKNWLDRHVEELNDPEYRKNHPEVNPFRNIIPVVKDGDPIQRTCFHPIIKLAIDRGLLKWYEVKDWNLKTEINNGKQGAGGNFIDLIIAVLSPSDIEEFRRRDKIRRRMQAVFACVSIAVMLGVIGFTIDYRMPHVSYYEDYALVNELPQGVSKISKNEVKTHSDSYKITKTKFNKTIKIEHINSRGTPVAAENLNHIDSGMIAVYRCRDNWLPDTCEFQDNNGIVQMTYAYATDLGYVGFQENEFVSEQVYPIAELNDYGIANHLKIDRYGLTHDEDGHLIKKMYMSGVNYVYDDNGVAGEMYDYDKEGRLIYLHYINRDEEYVNNQNGIHGIRFDYESDGTLSGYAYVNKNDEIIYGTEGYAQVLYELNVGEKTETFKYLDPENNLINIDSGYAIEKHALNDEMLISDVSYYDKNNEAAFNTEDYHKVSYNYDKKGNITAVSFYNSNGELIACKDGYAKETRTVDDNGNIIRDAYFNSEGSPVILENKVSVIEKEYNDHGYLVKESNFGINGEPVYSTDGYVSYINSYDDKNRLTSTEYLGLDDEKTAYTLAGYHKIVFAYDDRGNMKRVSLYNSFGNLITYSGYWAEQVLSYNGGGQVTKAEYYNQFGKPVMTSGGYATIENEYDDSGLLLQTSYYDSAGELCDNYSFVSNNYLAGDRFYAKIKFQYDENGNVIRTDYYDPNDNLVSDYLFSTMEAEYNDIGLVTTERYLNSDGEPTTDYVYYRTYHYDDYGNRIKTEFFGPNDVPMTSGNFIAGSQVHSIEAKFNERGQNIESKFLDINGNSVRDLVIKYDDNGNKIEETYLGADESPVAGPDGFSIHRYEYDDMGNLTRESYLDTDENLFMLNQGFSVCERKYNDSGSVTDICYYDSEGNPVTLGIGYFHLHEDLNEYRNTVNAEFRDVRDDLICSYQGDRNSYQQLTKQAYYSADGNLFEHPDYGIAMITKNYNEKGQQTEERYFDAEENLTLLLDMCAGWDSEYNEDSSESRRTFIGVDGNPKMITNGFASVSFTYDEYGREIERCFYDQDGNSVNTVFGFASYKLNYNDEGEVEDYKFFDKDGNNVEADGEVKKVELLLHDGNVKTYDIDFIMAPEAYHVYRIAFESSSGEYDLMLQPYLPFSPNEVSMRSIISEVTKKNQIVLNTDGSSSIQLDADLQDFFVEYTDIIRNADADRLMDFLNQEAISNSLAINIKQWGVDKTADEILEFYHEFYESELENFRNQLQENYGDFEVSYNILSRSDYTGESLQQASEVLKQQGIEGLEEYVTFQVAFTVSGNGKEEIVTDSFFHPDMVLAKFSGNWKLMSPDGFPAPDKESLREFLGLN